MCIANAHIWCPIHFFIFIFSVFLCSFIHTRAENNRCLSMYQFMFLACLSKQSKQTNLREGKNLICFCHRNVVMFIVDHSWIIKMNTYITTKTNIKTITMRIAAGYKWGLYFPMRTKQSPWQPRAHSVTISKIICQQHITCGFWGNLLLL